MASTAGLAKDVIDLMERKLALLTGEVAVLTTRISKLEIENGELRAQLKHSPQVVQVEITDLQQTILRILAGVESMRAEEIAKRLQVGQHVADHHLDKLYQAGMIWAEFATYGAPICWLLMPTGRDYLVERGLLK